MKSVIISVGGSTIIPGSDLNTTFLAQFRSTIRSLFDQFDKIVIICGGGSIARTYISGLQKLGTSSHEHLDEMGIACTRLNAEAMKTLFEDDAYENILLKPCEMPETKKRVFVGGGTRPGQSSDAAMIEYAQAFGIKKILNISNIDYIYTKDPKKHDDAKPLVNATWDEVLDIVGDSWTPGLNTPFDPIASKKAKELGITVHALSANTENLKRCLLDEEFIGTTISN